MACKTENLKLETDEEICIDCNSENDSIKVVDEIVGMTSSDVKDELKQESSFSVFQRVKRWLVESTSWEFQKPLAYLEDSAADELDSQTLLWHQTRELQSRKTRSSANNMIPSQKVSVCPRNQLPLHQKEHQALIKKVKMLAANPLAWFRQVGVLQPSWHTGESMSYDMSVYRLSLFHEFQHQPRVLLNIIYHWAVQTPIAKVLESLNIDSNDLESCYAILRKACATAMQSDDLFKSAEIDVTTIGSGKSKVFILGVYDHECGQIRLNACEIIPEGNQIFQPLHKWVDGNATIMTNKVFCDVLTDLGFSQDLNELVVPNPVMAEYLDKVVPQMFIKGVDHLSVDTIQQFLDELAWREKNGRSCSEAFDNIIRHLVVVNNKKRPKVNCGECYVKAPISSTCIECNEPMHQDRHLFLDQISCGRCSYSTSCGLSMANHQKKHLKKSKSDRLIGPGLVFDQTVKCKCGVSCGTSLAVGSHYEQCEIASFTVCS